uniref:Uncharacterized protein LOC111136665 n=1 Tax=Crassostrea virginica TaxID=6565 RepID=A0A8B8ETU9_CRAVI|nr:uncharacterized protein LOC111136665 [Crassostrea virginica]
MEFSDRIGSGARTLRIEMTAKVKVLPVFMLCVFGPVVCSLPKYFDKFERQARISEMQSSSSEVSRLQRYMLDRPNLPISTAERSVQRNTIRPSEPFSTDIDLPWQCEYEYFWRDLGELHFPRHLKEVRCLNTTCWYGHYRCVPAKHTARILTKSLGGDEDGNLPFPLRLEWKFDNIDITVGCMCSR